MAWFDDLNLPGSTVTGHFAFVREDGPDEDDFPDLQLASGTVTFQPTASAVRAGGAWVGISPVTARIFEGEIVVSEGDLRPVRILSTDADTGVDGWGWIAHFSIDDADLKPIRFRAPTEGVHLTGDDLIPITGQPVEVIEGADGASVVGARDNGDQTLTFLLSDGTETDPVAIPPGPAGVGIASISDPDAESLVTITYTDGSTSTVQAITGAPGHTPVISWDGTTVVIDGEHGPDLQGPAGELSEVPSGVTRGGATTGGSIELTRVGGARILSVSGVTATGSESPLVSLDAEDGGSGTGLLLASEGGVQHMWPAIVTGTVVDLPGPVTAGHVLDGSIYWRH